MAHHLLLDDLMICESLEFTCPATALSSRGFAALEDQAKAACATIGIELVDYDTYMAIPVQGNYVIRLYGKMWVRRQFVA